MIRFKQQIPEEECIEILKNEPRGVLSVLGDDDYPYGMPINHFYCEEDGRLYFHTGMKGHRTDAIRRHDKVSFCVMDKGYRKDGDWALNFNSVVVFGRIAEMTDKEQIVEKLRLLGNKYAPDEEYVENEINKFIHRVCMLEMTIDHMTGKLVKES
jgi:nitroimidazol reductase NimA-like FMN-containing flavoprotein (pyridoxamine 5'-phosphate oxidase superfamily)